MLAETRSIGGYELLFRVGSGGMAEVFAACARREGGFARLVAVKRILPALAEDAEVAAMLLDEARIAASIDSPHVVTARDLGRAPDGQPFLVMDLVIGVPLTTLVAHASRASVPIPIGIVLEIVAQAAAGLHAAHEARSPAGAALEIVHRDVSPQNVLLGADGIVRVSDFGIARATERIALTSSPRLKGKLAYAAPEQIASGAVDRRADVYGLAVVAAELATGRRIFPRDVQHTPERVRAIAAGDLRALRADLPAGAADALARALDPDPAARWGTTRALSDALAAACAPERRAGAEALAAYVRATAPGEISTLEASIRHAMRDVGPERTHAAAPRRTLRSYGTSFVGRERDLEAVAELVRGPDRLITLLGPGGIGKTRLAVEAAHRLAPELDVRFADLTEARSADGVCHAVGVALGISKLEGGDHSTSAAEIGEALARCGPTLLVLDNLEQVVAVAAPAIARWMAAAPQVTFLSTSRERIHVDGEVLYELEPLATDGVGAAALASPAARLFVERASRVRRGLVVSESDAPHVAEIVRRLDGLPLAIELAASRMRTLDPAQLASQLDARFRALSRSARDASPRQATLEAAIRWSWDLLDERERSVFSRCAVFHGGFDAPAACEVARDDGADAIVEQLVDKSLLRVQSAGGAARFTMYESIRAFALQELEARGELAAAHEQHVAWCLGLADAWAESEHSLAAQIAAIQGELENVLAAHAWLLAHRREGATRTLDLTRLAIALEPLLSARGPSSLLRQLFAASLADPDADAALPPALAVRARLALARGLSNGGHAAEALATGERARSIAAATRDDRLLASVDLQLADVAWAQGRMRECIASCARAIDAARRAGERRLEARGLARTGAAHVLLGEVDEAHASLRTALATARALGDVQLEGRVEAALADLHGDVGDDRAAAESATRALALARQIADQGLIAGSLSSLGVLHAEPAQRIALLEEALAVSRDAGNERALGLFLGILGHVVEEAGDAERALRTYDESLAASRRAQNQLAEGMTQAWRGRLLARRGELDAAESALDDAASILERIGDRVRWQVAYLCRGHLDLARAAAGAKDAAEHVTSAHERARSARRALLPSREVREALHALERALAPLGEPPEPGPERATLPGPPAQAGLVIDRGRRTFSVGGGEEVSLRTRGSLWLLLEHLVRRHAEAPDAGDDVEALFAAGWPGEKAHPRSAASRVYVAMSTLRGLGLKDLLVRRSDGYLLDPQAAVIAAG